MVRPHQTFSRLYLLPERTATAITDWALNHAKDQLGDAAYDPSQQDAFYTAALAALDPTATALMLRATLGGEWDAEAVQILFARIGLTPKSQHPPSGAAEASHPE
jgi:hypothetical protein